MHPLSTRWPKSAAVLAVIALGACAPDQTVSTSPDVQDFAGAARNTVDYSSVTLSGEVSLKVGTSTKLSVRTSSRSRGSIKWQSSNPSAASVNSQGNVTGQAVGLAYVTASGFAVNETYLVSVTPAFTLSGFTLSPKTSTALAPGQTRQFSTQQIWSDGQTRDFGVTYTATGGSISSSGLFTAGSVAGSFMVIANCLCGALDTAFVTVELPAQLTKITVSPKTVSLNAGATQQFGATANWSTGATTLPPITWSATGGSISTGGLYTAPTTAGTYRVIVAHSGGALRDTATVTVAGVVVNEPSGTAACPNEPSSYTLYGDVSFASTIAPTGFSFWGDNKSIVSDQTAPGGKSAIAWKKLAGTNAGSIGFVATQTFTNAPRAVYSCVVFKRSANYVEHPSGTKFIYPNVLNATGPGRPFQMGMLPQDSIKSGKFYWMVEMYSGDAVRRMRGSNRTNTILQNDKWYRLEFLAVSNTPGAQNSVLRWWTSEWNGTSWSAPVLNGDWTDVMMTPHGTGAWSSWDYNLYYGGSDGPLLSADQSILLSQARISLGW